MLSPDFLHVIAPALLTTQCRMGSLFFESRFGTACPSTVLGLPTYAVGTDAVTRRISRAKRDGSAAALHSCVLPVLSMTSALLSASCPSTGRLYMPLHSRSTAHLIKGCLRRPDRPVLTSLPCHVSTSPSILCASFTNSSHPSVGSVDLLSALKPSIAY
jgi:hypothetical protein